MAYNEDIYSLEDRLNVLYIKNQLINAPLEKLKERFSSYDNFGLFIESLTVALDAEPAFFLLDDALIRKAEDVVAHRRFDYMTPEYNAIINQIIGQIHYLRDVPEAIKQRQLNAYVEWQHSVRQLGYMKKSDFLDILANDALLVQRLAQGNIGEMAPIDFFASTNYLVQVVPDFFQGNEEAIDLIFKRLDEHAKKKGILKWPERSFAKETIKNIQKIKTKEE